ncbi:MAG: threonine synthase [Oscillospiraceae bacterium]|nr:threonine synthase [Oscillospiraceae bacterium]
MKYQCTRDSSVTVTASQAIVQGIAKNGGLFVPETLPAYTLADLTAMNGQSYFDRAAKVVSDFLPEFTPEEIEECVQGAYGGGKFSGGHPAPVVAVKDGDCAMNILELWHGPTCAFKDMALQLLPHLLTHSLRKTKCEKTAVILVATSGDTGKAALEGFKDVKGTEMLVFYPENGVSPMQKRQMNTQEGSNVSVCAIEGNFDDAQTGVKKLFVDPAINEKLHANGMLFSSANSINWGRLLPQIVYYVSAYSDLMERGAIQPGDPINVVVPTGNFGNILAGYYASKMGLPVNKFICASNSNNVLTDFLKTGEYNRNRDFHATISPSMDILISSNLERLLYDVTGHDCKKVAGWMQELSEKGCYKVDDETFQKISAVFDAGFCSDEDTKKTIRQVYDNAGYLCDTHTAVAVKVYEDYVARTGDKTPTVIDSTASPYKFASSVLSAVDDQYDDKMDEFDKVERLSKLTGTEVPAPIAGLKEKPVRFQNVCEKEQMGDVLLRLLGLA